MRVSPITFSAKRSSTQKYTVNDIGKKTELPEGKRNYTFFNQPLVEFFVSRREAALPRCSVS